MKIKTAFVLVIMLIALMIAVAQAGGILDPAVIEWQYLPIVRANG